MTCILNRSKANRCQSPAGRLRQKIEIQKLTRHADGAGGATESWSKFADCYAEVSPVSAAQLAFYEKLEHRVTHKILIRYLPGLSHEMRVLFEGRVFQVQSFRDLEERHQFHEIMAEEGKPT